jgi:hypothetical protein
VVQSKRYSLTVRHHQARTAPVGRRTNIML